MRRELIVLALMLLVAVEATRNAPSSGIESIILKQGNKQYLLGDILGSLFGNNRQRTQRGRIVRGLTDGFITQLNTFERELTDLVQGSNVGGATASLAQALLAAQSLDNAPTEAAA
eukprot:TRINITY_DN57778_c0_g1_i1.p1 TRINITY_DN57778_c0_g1~~TRINITY_DN57778_c0_g1_i1.p1  ORF type:complete len:116 (-),score=19.44 TRINITY_DN57778_c0_g1_i1:179-526(-)